MLKEGTERDSVQGSAPAVWSMQPDYPRDMITLQFRLQRDSTGPESFSLGQGKPTLLKGKRFTVKNPDLMFTLL